MHFIHTHILYTHTTCLDWITSLVSSNITEKHNQSKRWVVKPNPNRYIYNTTPSPKVKGHCRRGGRKIWESQRIEDFAVRLCSLRLPEATHIKSLQHDWTKAATDTESKQREPKGDLNPGRTAGIEGILREGERIFRGSSVWLVIWYQMANLLWFLNAFLYHLCLQNLLCPTASSWRDT